MTTAAAAAAMVFPKWVLLEPYVFRGDGDDKSFPDDTVAPIRASGTTSLGADFSIAFSLADPPSISRLHAHLPAGSPGPLEANPLDLVATHRHLALLCVTSEGTSAAFPQGLVLQDFFIFRPDQNNPSSSSSITALPPCTEPLYDIRGDPRRHHTPSFSSNAAPPPRLLHAMSSGLWCGAGDDKGEEEEFVVAELSLFVPAYGRKLIEAFADICFLRSSLADDQLARREWDTVRVPILSTTDDDLRKLSRWITHTVISFQRWMCWISYHHGILIWDVSSSSQNTVSFLWFPPDTYSLSSTLRTPCSGNGVVSVIGNDEFLKFVYVARRDSGPAFGELKPGTGFIITSHTLVLGLDGRMEWNKDCTVTSDDLPDAFQRGGLPMFPHVQIDRPEVVHFLFVESINKPYRKMSVLSIDMSKKTVVSFYLYMDGGNPPLQTEDAHFIMAKCSSPIPSPFLPWFCNLSRKIKGME